MFNSIYHKWDIQLNARREFHISEQLCILFIKLTRRSQLYSCFKKRRCCHSFMEQNRVSSMSAVDWHSQTWKIVLIFTCEDIVFLSSGNLYRHFSLSNKIFYLIWDSLIPWYRQKSFREHRFCQWSLVLWSARTCKLSYSIKILSCSVLFDNAHVERKMKLLSLMALVPLHSKMDLFEGRWF